MTNTTKRNVVSSVSLIGTGAIVLPLVGIALEALMEIMNMPIWAEKVDSWFGAGSIVGLLVLTAGYRIVASIYNSIQEKNAVGRTGSQESVKI